jgi:hypothetical protein
LRSLKFAAFPKDGTAKKWESSTCFSCHKNQRLHFGDGYDAYGASVCGCLRLCHFFVFEGFGGFAVSCSAYNLRFAVGVAFKMGWV